MKIAFFSSEVSPFAKTGGLADVSGSLPKVLSELGNDVKVFMPKYSSISDKLCSLEPVHFDTDIIINVAGENVKADIFSCTLPDNKTEIYFIGQKKYFNRAKIYTEEDDEDERFIFFQKAAIEVLQRLQWQPDVIHCNDWQTGLVPAFLKYNYNWDRFFDKVATLFTIHNIGYQGMFPMSSAFKADLDQSLIYPAGPAEYYGKVNFLKVGIVLSDKINTVSKTYSKEILTPEFGAGMEGILKSRKNDLYGIINGIDYNEWNPEIDNNIPYNYSNKNISGKLRNKKYLLDQINFEFNKDIPLIGMISRIVSQKGFDILADAVQYLAKLPAQWIILGTGDKKYEDKIIDIAQKYPENLRANLFFNNELAHIIEASSDIFLMPSKYEPCGLNQIYSLKYGTVPIVRKTGGLADTVIDWEEDNKKGNGFVFEDYNGYELYSTVKRALKSFKNKRDWRKIQKNGMDKDYSWENSATHYIDLYKKAIEKRREIIS